MDNGELVYDLAPIEVPVKVKDRDGRDRQFVLREASGASATKHRGLSIASLRFGKHGRAETIAASLADAEPILISECLYEADENGKVRSLANGDPDPKFLVPLKVIQSWPAKVTRAIYERLKVMSDLGESGADVEPEMIALCRRDLNREYHPDVTGGKSDVMTGINVALDWFKEHVKETAEARAKNELSAT
jgi:hypothetical protein